MPARLILALTFLALVSFPGGASAVNSACTERFIELATKTPKLTEFGRDLTLLASQGKLDPVIGRVKELGEAFEILGLTKKNNPVFIGEPGVGKTALAEGLAQLIADGRAPSAFKNHRVIQLDLTAMVGNTKFRGEFEQRMKLVLAELEANPDIIIFIDEIHTVLGVGTTDGGQNAANLLKPALARGLKCIGATTLDEYKLIEKDGALERRFQKVVLQPPNDADVLLILVGLREKFEKHHGVTISDEALKEAIELTNRYVPGDRFQPDKAITAVDRACSRARLLADPGGYVPSTREELVALKKELAKAIGDEQFELAASLSEKIKVMEGAAPPPPPGTKIVVGVEDIRIVVSKETGIPLETLGTDEAQKLLVMETALKKVVVGQDEAISQISKAVRLSRAGLRDPKRPIGTFVFAGPTGVGKTLLTRKLGEYMFGTEEAVIELNMTEFAEKHTVGRLIGAPPGYVGYEDGGQLTEKVRRRPYSVLVFDEIEKAAPEVRAILLKIMEDGQITDAKGRVVSFRNCIIILTTNKGARAVNFANEANAAAAAEVPVEADGFRLGAAPERTPPRLITQAEKEKMVMAELEQEFTPEFLGRPDGIIVFNTLTKEQMHLVVEIEANKLRKLLEAKALTLTLSGEAKDYILAQADVSKTGGRNLRKQIEDNLSSPIAELILRGSLTSAKGVSVTVEGTGADRHLVFEAIAP